MISRFGFINTIKSRLRKRLIWTDEKMGEDRTLGNANFEHWSFIEHASKQNIGHSAEEARLI